jgi:hypothetical protein
VRADLGGFLADGAFALAGLAVLWGLGLVERGRSVPAALGLAYLVGVAVVCVVLIALLTVGVPFTLGTFVAVVVACVAVGVAAGLRRGGRPPAERRSRRISLRDVSPDGWIVAGFAVALAAYALWGVVATREIPIEKWDAWTIWSRKGEMLAASSTLVEGFFAGPAYAFMHQDYPLLFPIWEAVHFRAAGAIDTQAIHGHMWLLLVAFAWAAAYLVREVAKPVVWAPILLAVAAAHGAWWPVTTAYADVPVAIFGAIGALATGLWVARGRPGDLAVGTIALAGAASLKNEGLMVAAAVLIAAGAVTVVSRRGALRAWALAALGFVLAVLPWRVWMAAHDVEGDLPISKGLDPGYLIDRSDRVRPSISSINEQLSNQGEWVYLVPLAVLVVLACLVTGVSRRLAAFYAASATLVWALLVWAYWISHLDLGYHLESSVDRVVAVLLFVCAVAVLHLSGRLASAVAPPDRRD